MVVQYVHLEFPAVAMDLRARLRDVNDLTDLPSHIEVRRSGSKDERCLLIFTDATPFDNKNNSWFRQCTGTIIAPIPGSDGEGKPLGYDVVGYAGPRSLEVFVDDESAKSDEVPLSALDPTGVEWYPYVEGVRMILYSYGGEWRLSTSRVIDARTSRYFRGSPTFGEQFDAAARCAGLDMGRLDVGKCYVFIVQSRDTPMVVRYDGHDLLHVATYDMATLAEVIDCDIGVARPAWMPLSSFQGASEGSEGSKGWDVVREMLAGPIGPARLGAIARGGKNKGWHAKIMHPDYAAARDLVGGERDLEKRMLSIAANPALKARLLTLMPEKRAAMLAVDAAIDAATDRVHRLYVEFNVRHRRTPLPQPVYETLKALHREYLARPFLDVGVGSQCVKTTKGKRSPMTFGDVDAFVRGLPTLALASLVRETSS